ncbi:DUF726-domain-containing protein [Xylona heveae TC161]|uniref:DUF726-domain-containing protein n=1 Tax=Xylona heveae (strain CBS 132557 / TC161) TaxID=1328760 RepID=A0A165JFD6_XYLHT|nr:DUF726-domain-containing protein [Xylona heveae TC161]KZF26163.1 DUF726-domain-containing protein [Xylona heveae TC161]
MPQHEIDAGDDSPKNQQHPIATHLEINRDTDQGDTETNVTATQAPSAALDRDEFGLPLLPSHSSLSARKDQDTDSRSNHHDAKPEIEEGNITTDVVNETNITEGSSNVQEENPERKNAATNSEAFSQTEVGGKLETPKEEHTYPSDSTPPDYTHAPAEILPTKTTDTFREQVPEASEVEIRPEEKQEEKQKDDQAHDDTNIEVPGHSHKASTGHVSEWSHQQVAASHEPEEKYNIDEDDWQEMPAYAPYDIYNDDGKLIAKEAAESDNEGNYGPGGRGYTRVQIDEDAKSTTSMDENTKYLFKENGTNVADEDEDLRDALSQMQVTKDLLTEGQKIAYVGLTRLAMIEMVKELEAMPQRKSTKSELVIATESIKMWSQKMTLRLYTHMDISSEEQIMIEQLAEHGVVAADLTPTLLQNSRVKNPMAEKIPSKPPSSVSPRPSSTELERKSSTPSSYFEGYSETPPPPPYQEHEGDDLPEVRTPNQLPSTKNIDIDLRWTVLCDLFLVLISDSIYDSRSRVLLERVGNYLSIPWIDICRFEKRVTDALEMEEAAAAQKENWTEEEHMAARKKAGMKRRMVMMGLATVGGGLVIGLSAGLLAPVIGAGLAAGFTTIGVAGTGTFLAGTGGAALITTTAALSGGAIAVRASHRRMGAVKTFEYRPLHNNKRVNLIITVAGWMNGKVDDVRLPYSTVDPIMGDLYSVLWEPEMLQSMGDTINILATEALTQGLQQVLGSTVLVALMASLQLPIVLTKLSYLIDNPWTVSLDRANAAGLILADSLIDRNLGVRPITLVGFSLGARVIFSCLRELASRGAYGLIQNVYLFGSPIVAKRDEYLRARAIVSGRFVNGYATNDWILGYLFRATSGGIMRVAGLAPVLDVPRLENIDVTTIVPGHMAYRSAMPRLLREVGWLVESDEFAEIEDPDPENHQARQRELIAEIDEARKKLDDKPSKKIFGLFNRKKMAEKKGWETYDDTVRTGGGGSTARSSAEGQHQGYDPVLFDIDAIRAELASEQVEVRQLESTLPPMKLDLSPPKAASTGLPSRPVSGLKESMSYDSGLAQRSRSEAASPLPPLPPTFNSSPGGTTEAASASQDSHRILKESYFDYDDDNFLHGESSNIQMSFEPPAGGSSNPSPLSRSTTTTTLPTFSDVSSQPPLRPELRSSVTMPATFGVAEQDAWADDEHDEFGHEKEIQLSFE